jgi:nitroreductase
MNRRTFLKAVPVTLLAAQASNFGLAGTEPGSTTAPTGGGASSGTGLQPIVLPKPQTEGGKSVLAALQDRRTVRTMKEDPLPPQILSNLLWAAFGVNRERFGSGTQAGRTAASASNSQEVDLYVALPDGIYLYEAVPHRLVPVVAGDHRAKAGNRGRGARAPVRIIFVVDIAKFAKAPFQEPGLRDPDIQKSYYCVDTGLIAGNVYLVAAATGLAAWFHNCDKPALTKTLNLRPDQRVIYTQSVGYPA